MHILHSPLIYAIAWAVVLLAVGGLMTPIDTWYERLRKPSWQPPGWAFGPAWTAILGLAAWSAVRGWNAGTPAQHIDILIIYGVNALFHLLWSPLFFRLRRPDWALVEVPFLWASVLALMVGLWHTDTSAAMLIAPYLVWVSFAAFLNWKIVQLNPSPLTEPAIRR